MVVIIGILAAVAIPTFIRGTERARAGQALTYLGEIRSAEARYSGQQASAGYTATLKDLDVDIVAPTGWDTATVNGGGTATGFVTLTRNNGPNNTKTLGITFGAGKICGSLPATVWPGIIDPCAAD